MSPIEEAYRNCRRRIIRRIRRMSDGEVSIEDAKDMAQDIASRALLKFDENASPVHIIRWMMTAAKNAAIDVLRAKQPEFEPIEGYDFPADEQEDGPYRRQSPRTRALVLKLREVLKAFRLFNPEGRVLLIRYFVLRQTYRALGEVTGTSHEDVRQKVLKGKRIIENALEPLPPYREGKLPPPADPGWSHSRTASGRAEPGQRAALWRRRNPAVRSVERLTA